MALGVLLVPIARALLLVAISSRGHTLALLAAYPTVFQAPVLHPCFCAPIPALGVAEAYSNQHKIAKSATTNYIFYSNARRLGPACTHVGRIPTTPLTTILGEVAQGFLTRKIKHETLGGSKLLSPMRKPFGQPLWG